MKKLVATNFDNDGTAFLYINPRYVSVVERVPNSPGHCRVYIEGNEQPFFVTESSETFILEMEEILEAASQ